MARRHFSARSRGRRADTVSVTIGQRPAKAQPSIGLRSDGTRPGISASLVRPPLSSSDEPSFGYRAQQPARVGMQRLARTDLAHAGLLHLAAGIHHHNALRHLGHHAKVVRDQHDRRAKPRLQLAHQVEDLQLDRHVQRRRRLVGDQQLRVAGQRHGDHHPLAHPARELVRILPHPPPGAGMPTSVSISTARCLRLAARSCPDAVAASRRSACPPVSTGLRLVIGSWKIMADVVAAKLAHLRFGQTFSRSRPLKRMLARDLAGRLLDQPQDRHRRHRLAAPDSPTIATVSPPSIVKDRPSTARTTPSGVPKCVCRLAQRRAAPFKTLLPSGEKEAKNCYLLVSETALPAAPK